MSNAPFLLAQGAIGGLPSEVRASVCFDLTGQVQGVGIRPYVFRLANELGLEGTVHNMASGARVEAWGSPQALAEFSRRLVREAPALARIDNIATSLGDGSLQPPSGFSIAPSDPSLSQRGRITVDAAVCDACLEELRNPEDRRHSHGLINCTDCGPRYSIVLDLPYDRPATTMAGFEMCPHCAAEYTNPSDRRFHAQPVCCPNCGPMVTFVAEGGSICDEYPFEAAAHLLESGGILAMKGLGGFHLVVDATNEAAVRRLRMRKRRAHKPFALLVANLDQAKTLVDLSASAEALLTSAASPIVIAPRAASGSDLSVGLAPGQERLGIMLPNTPMQHLLIKAHPRPLVMTSANLSDDPLVKDDDEAADRLSGVADAFLTHDRPIERAVDDSVFIDAEPAPLPVRRARGYVPEPIPLRPAPKRPGLCMGADLKNVVAIVRGSEAVLSQHIGDLTHTLALLRNERTVDDLCRLFDVAPDWIAVDAHPRYLSRRAGERFAADRGLPVLHIQHHHAHLASLLAEYGRTDRIVGLVCDGVGYGMDGAAWGGEVLVGDLAHFERAAHLRPLRLPGGDAAARITGRCAASWLVDAIDPSHPAIHRVLPEERVRNSVLGMLASDLNCPPSTGAGRLFDAAAALLGICDYNHFEAMSGQLLEGAATRSAQQPDGSGLMPIEAGEIDTRPLLIELLQRQAAGHDPEDLAWLFHSALADGLSRAALQAAATHSVRTLGLTGGVFCNTLLTQQVRAALEDTGLEVLTHRRVPPNDGGIALGQAAIAAATLHASCV